MTKSAAKISTKFLKTPSKALFEKPLPASKTSRSLCAINLALEVVGDSWSLLIIRDLMFKGRKSFQAFLSAEEKIATNILTDRLVKLEVHGLISRQVDPADKRKVIYGLTSKGADLASVLIELMAWSHKYTLTDTPKEVRAEIEKNKSGFATRVVKGLQIPEPYSPALPKPIKNIRELEFSDETLSLF